MKNSFKYMLSISLLLIIGCAGFAVSAAAGGPTTILYEGMEAEEKFPQLLERKIYTYNCLSACVTYPGAGG